MFLRENISHPDLKENFATQSFLRLSESNLRFNAVFNFLHIRAFTYELTNVLGWIQMVLRQPIAANLYQYIKITFIYVLSMQSRLEKVSFYDTLEKET